MVLCDLYLKRFDLTKGLLFKTFVITVLYKLCRRDHSVLEFKRFTTKSLIALATNEVSTLPRGDVDLGFHRITDAIDPTVTITESLTRYFHHIN